MTVAFRHKILFVTNCLLFMTLSVCHTNLDFCSACLDQDLYCGSKFYLKISFGHYILVGSSFVLMADALVRGLLIKMEVPGHR
jgi:hypothetical protein